MHQRTPKTPFFKREPKARPWPTSERKMEARKSASDHSNNRFLGSYMDVEPKIGVGVYPPKWMVYFMVPNPSLKFMIWEVFPLFLG